MTMDLSLWHQCVQRLKEEMQQQAFNRWISPLQAEISPYGLMLWAPNQYVLDGITKDYLAHITNLLSEFSQGNPPRVVVGIGTRQASVEEEREAQGAAVPLTPSQPQQATNTVFNPSAGGGRQGQSSVVISHQCNLNTQFTFTNFVVGKSNQLAEAAAKQVAENPGGAYNPLFLYGGVGLGKTHLMHAIGNQILADNPKGKVIYLHSERFVADMVKALQSNTINEFKRFYRSVDALLIDDIQFFAGKERSQEEFFHTFNALLG